MDDSTPGLPAHHQLQESTQTHLRWVVDAIQPSYLLPSPSPLPSIFPSIRVFSKSQLFAWGGQSIGVSVSTSVLPMNTQDWSPWGWTGWISLQSKGLSRVFSNTTVQKHQKDWCWSWNFNTLATWCEELTHWKSPWCWERLRAGGEGDNRGWDGWMASQTQWTWVWVNSGNWWWTRKPGVLQFMGSQRVGHDWATELSWTDGHFWLQWQSPVVTTLITAHVT